MQNGIGTQYSLIIQSFGFNTLQTTLLNIPSGCTVRVQGFVSGKSLTTLVLYSKSSASQAWDFYYAAFQ
jgi:hypothetical protein